MEDMKLLQQRMEFIRRKEEIYQYMQSLSPEEFKSFTHVLADMFILQQEMIKDLLLNRPFGD